MSTNEPTEDKSGRRRGVRSRRRPAKKSEEEGEGTGEESKETKPRRTRPEIKSIPVPPELEGKMATGKIFDVSRGYRNNFGFILIDVANSTAAEKPKIYFNLAEFDSTEHIARRGYKVAFSVAKDEQGRFAATKVVLTPEGKVAAKERDIKIAEEKVQRDAAASANPNGESKEERKPRRVRAPNPNRDITINVSVSVEGQAPKVLEVKPFNSIGRLKYAAIEAFQIPISYEILTASGERLNKTLLRALKDGDSLKLAPGPEEKADA